MICVSGIYSSVYAETPKDCYAKHGDRLAIFVHTEPLLSDVENFNIERIAIDRAGKHIYVKTIQNEEYIVFNIEDMKRPDGYVMFLILEGGKVIAIDDDFQIAFKNEDDRVALFQFNKDKTLKLRELQSK